MIECTKIEISKIQRFKNHDFVICTESGFKNIKKEVFLPFSVMMFSCIVTLGDINYV